MKKIKLLLNIIIIIGIFTIWVKYIFPTHFEKYMTGLSSLVLNFINTNKKDFENLKKYGIELNFPKSKWFYHFNYNGDVRIVDITSALPSELNRPDKKCDLKIFSIEIFKKNNDREKIINYFKRNCSYKKLDINGKKYYMYLCNKNLYEYKKCQIYSPVYIVPFKSNIIILYYSFRSDDARDLKKLKEELSFIKFKQ